MMGLFLFLLFLYLKEKFGAIVQAHGALVNSVLPEHLLGAEALADALESREARAATDADAHACDLWCAPAPVALFFSRRSGLSAECSGLLTGLVYAAASE